MITFFDIDIGTLSFFIFSFLVGVVALFQSIFGCAKETKKHRIVRGTIGAVYAVITVIAFTQLEIITI